MILQWSQIEAYCKKARPAPNRLQLDVLKTAVINFGVQIEDAEDAVERVRDGWASLMNRTHAITNYDPDMYPSREQWWKHEGCPQAAQLFRDTFAE